MNYNLKSVNGMVTFLLRAGKDLVRNQMTVSAAQKIIDSGTLKKSNVKDYPICVDNKWYFEGEIIKKTVAPTEEG